MNPKTCPTCHSPVPDNAPGGLCPACVLRDADEPAAGAADAPSLAELAAAFPKLEILRLIGHGGMGFVYQARQPELDRMVALKILSPSLRSDPAFEERFAREARVLGKLQHPNIVTLFEHGEAGGFFYLMMEYIDGVNLRQAMSAGRFTPGQALGIVPAICDALQSAHAEGIWHRDIKPENILLDRDGRVKIADFGIARILGDPERNFTLTRTGGMLGSAAYMAPEQHEKPHDVDHRADIYSLGVVIYEMLTGELPLGRFPAPSQRAAVNARIDEIVMRTLEKERELRQQSAGELKTAVETSVQSRCFTENGPAIAEQAWPWLVKLSLILFFSGALALIAFTASTEALISQFYWRKLWDPIDYGSTGLGLESPLHKQFLNLWFGSGLTLLAGGVGLGLWILYRIRRGLQSAAGWLQLRRFILWPCILFIPVRVFAATNDGMNPLMFHRGQIQYALWITYAITLLVAGLLFFIGSRPEGIRPPGRSVRIAAAIASALLMVMASVVTKRLNDHWTDKNFPFELSWALDSLNESERIELSEALAKTCASFGGQLQKTKVDGHDHLTVRLIIHEQPYFIAYRNQFLLRLRAAWPRHNWGMGEYSTTVWWETKSAMHGPAVFVIMAAILAAITAAWCGFPMARVAVLSGTGIAVAMAILPAWPIPKEIDRQILNGPPPAPRRPFVPDFSEPTLAVQSVFDAAFLGEEQLVREGMSERLLAELASPEVFQAAMKQLGNRWWVTNPSGNEHVWVLNAPLPSAFKITDLVDVIKEDARWKLAELPKK